MRKKEKWTSTSEIIEFIKRCLQHLDDLQDDDNDLKPIVIMIHSMDVGVLKGQEWQEMLGELSTCKKTRFIVSVDNIKSGVLFTD